MAKWAWDNVHKLWRDPITNGVLPLGQIQEWVNKGIVASTGVMDAHLTTFANGDISATAWKNLMREQIKQNYIAAYMPGVGGYENMTQADWGRIGAMVKEQYKYLDGFYEEVKSGKLTPEQIRVRQNMYLNSSREAFETAVKRNASTLDMEYERWVIGSQHPCEDCQALAGMDWVPMGTFRQIPGDGTTRCKTNCQCHIEYRNSTGAKYGRNVIEPY